MTEQVKCPYCGHAYDAHSEQHACIQLYGECQACCIAHQRQVDILRVRERAQMIRPPVITDTLQERVFTVRIRSSKPIMELERHIANRLWSMDKVTDVIAIEQ